MLRLRRLAPAVLPPLLLLPSLLLRGQSAGEPNEGLRLVPDPAISGNYELRFWGRSGRTYFLLQNDDLTRPWTYFPVVETGQDAVISYGFTNPAPTVFVNLRYLDEALANPFGLDSDSDGLTNQQEFDLRTDLFKPDTDGDGLPDAWEATHGFDPRDPADALADANGNGVSNLDEYKEGTDPHFDFYQGVAPRIVVIEGADQARTPGTFLPLPLRLRVLRPDGTAWAGAPVRFKARADEGLLSLDNSGGSPLRPALTIYTDSDGYAQAWLKCP